MRVISGCVIALIMFSLCGCAALREMAADMPNVEPQAEIAAVDTLAGDLIANPWDEILTVGLGYGLAILRRWYKKKMGATSV